MVIVRLLEKDLVGQRHEACSAGRYFLHWSMFIEGKKKFLLSLSEAMLISAYKSVTFFCSHEHFYKYNKARTECKCMCVCVREIDSSVLLYETQSCLLADIEYSESIWSFTLKRLKSV